MLCNNCMHIKVCKHYAYNSGYGLIINMCNFFNQSNGAIGKTNIESFEPVNVLDIAAKKKKIASSYTKKDKALKKIVTCPTCGGKDYEEELSVCDNCSDVICGNCSIDSGNGKLLCEKCFKGE